MSLKVKSEENYEQYQKYRLPVDHKQEDRRGRKTQSESSDAFGMSSEHHSDEKETRTLGMSLEEESDDEKDNNDFSIEMSSVVSREDIEFELVSSNGDVDSQDMSSSDESDGEDEYETGRKLPLKVKSDSELTPKILREGTVTYEHCMRKAFMDHSFLPMFSRSSPELARNETTDDHMKAHGYTIQEYIDYEYGLLEAGVSGRWCRPSSQDDKCKSDEEPSTDHEPKPWAYSPLVVKSDSALVIKQLKECSAVHERCMRKAFEDYEVTPFFSRSSAELTRQETRTFTRDTVPSLKDYFVYENELLKAGLFGRTSRYLYQKTDQNYSAPPENDNSHMHNESQTDPKPWEYSPLVVKSDSALVIKQLKECSAVHERCMRKAFEDYEVTPFFSRSSAELTRQETRTFTRDTIPSLKDYFVYENELLKTGLFGRTSRYQYQKTDQNYSAPPENDNSRSISEYESKRGKENACGSEMSPPGHPGMVLYQYEKIVDGKWVTILIPKLPIRVKSDSDLTCKRFREGTVAYEHCMRKVYTDHTYLPFCSGSSLELSRKEATVDHMRNHYYTLSDFLDYEFGLSSSQLKARHRKGKNNLRPEAENSNCNSDKELTINATEWEYAPRVVKSESDLATKHLQKGTSCCEQCMIKAYDNHSYLPFFSRSCPELTREETRERFTGYHSYSLTDYFDYEDLQLAAGHSGRRHREDLRSEDEPDSKYDHIDSGMCNSDQELTIKSSEWEYAPMIVKSDSDLSTKVLREGMACYERCMIKAYVDHSYLPFFSRSCPELTRRETRESFTGYHRYSLTDYFDYEDLQLAAGHSGRRHREDLRSEDEPDSKYDHIDSGMCNSDQELTIKSPEWEYAPMIVNSDSDLSTKHLREGMACYEQCMIKAYDDHSYLPFFSRSCPELTRRETRESFTGYHRYSLTDYFDYEDLQLAAGHSGRRHREDLRLEDEPDSKYDHIDSGRSIREDAQSHDEPTYMYGNCDTVKRHREQSQQYDKSCLASEHTDEKNCIATSSDPEVTDTCLQDTPCMLRKTALEFSGKELRFLAEVRKRRIQRGREVSRVSNGLVYVTYRSKKSNNRNTSPNLSHGNQYTTGIGVCPYHRNDALYGSKQLFCIDCEETDETSLSSPIVQTTEKNGDLHSIHPTANEYESGHEFDQNSVTGNLDRSTVTENQSSKSPSIEVQDCHSHSTQAGPDDHLREILEQPMLPEYEGTVSTLFRKPASLLENEPTVTDEAEYDLQLQLISVRSQAASAWKESQKNSDHGLSSDACFSSVRSRESYENHGHECSSSLSFDIPQRQPVQYTVSMSGKDHKEPWIKQYQKSSQNRKKHYEKHQGLRNRKQKIQDDPRECQSSNKTDNFPCRSASQTGDVSSVDLVTISLGKQTTDSKEQNIENHENEKSNHSRSFIDTFTGKCINGYLFSRRIDDGAFSRVFLVEKDDNNFVAKVDSRPYSPNDMRSKILQHEFRVLRKLHHANVVKVFEYFVHGHGMMILEHMELGDVWTYFEVNWPIPAADIQRIFYEIMKAVHHIRKKGYVHMDIKTNNILMNGKGHVKLADFGGAKKYGAFARPRKFDVFTPEFAPPEKNREEEFGRRFSQVHKQYDIWSTGVVYYQLLTGRLPYSLQEGSRFIPSHFFSQPLTFPEEALVNQNLVSLIRRCLQKEPSDRIKPKDALLHSYFYAYPNVHQNN